MSYLILTATLSAAYTTVQQTPILHECHKGYCLQNWSGDYYCDKSCMSPPCNYDSLDTHSETWNQRMKSSDCYYWCAAWGCPIQKLGDGVCDSQCNYWFCGYDLADCAYCSYGCTLQSMSNDHCDTPCNTAYCYYDNGMCGSWCAQGCTQQMYQNDTCEQQCNLKLCDYDNNNCQPCSEGCYTQDIGNSYCDYNCYTQACNYDEGDCDCSQGCSQEDNNSQGCQQDDPCMVLDCGFKEGKCGYCAYDCFQQDLGDGICQKACFVEDCHWDQGDCGCYGVCESMEIDEVWNVSEQQNESPDCQTNACQYNYPQPGTNQTFEYFVEKNYFYHDIFSEIEFGLFNISDCEAAGCSQERLFQIWEKQSCQVQDECNDQSCLYCLGYSSLSHCDNDCLHCKSGEYCLRCKPEYFEFQGDCLEECPIGFEDISLVQSGLKPCVSMFDNSRSQSPAYIYVSTESNGQEDGSQQHPYSSLSVALKQVWREFTVIKLSKGNHVFKPDYTFSNYFVSDEYSPISRSQEIYLGTLTIEGDSEGSTISLREFMRFEPKEHKFALKNLVIEGSQILKEDCQEDWCMYCQYYQMTQKTKFDDRGDIIQNDIPENCQDYHEYSIISVQYKLEIVNVTFSNIRHQAKHIIYAQGEVILQNVDFYKIQVIHSVISVDGQKKDNFLYQGGLVSYMNDGYEYHVDVQFGQFLYLYQIVDIQIYNLAFNWTIDKKASTETQKAIIHIKQHYGELQVDQLRVQNTIAYIMFLIDDYFMIWDDYDNVGGISQNYAQQHILLTNLVFQNVFAYSSGVQVIMNAVIQNIIISHSNFTEVYCMKDSIINLDNSKIIQESDLNGDQIISKNQNGAQSESIWIPPRSLTLQDINILQSSALGPAIYLTKLVNTNIDRLYFKQFWDTFSTINLLMIFSPFVSNEQSYIQIYPQDILEDIYCTSLIQLNQLEKVNITDFSSDSCICSIGQESMSGLHFKQVKYDTYLSDIQFTNTYSESENSANLLQIDDCAKVYLQNLQIYNSTNQSGPLVQFSNTPEVQVSSFTCYTCFSQFESVLTFLRIFFVQISEFECVQCGSFQGTSGVIYIQATQSSDTGNPYISLIDSHFQNCSAPYGKAGILLLACLSSNIFLDLQFMNINVTESEGFNGGGFYLAESVSVNEAYFHNITMNKIQSSEGAPFIDKHLYGVVNYQDINFFENTGNWCGFQCQFNAQQGVVAQLIDLYMHDNSCYSGSISVDILNQLYIWVQDSYFYNNTGIQISISGGFAQIQHNQFYYNERALKGQLENQIRARWSFFTQQLVSTVQIHNYSLFFCYACDFIENHNGSPISSDQQSYLELRSCYFYRNYVTQPGSAINIMLTNQVSYIVDCDFIENYSQDGSTIQVLTSPLVFQNCYFSQNEAAATSPGITLNGSFLTIADSIFENQVSESSSFLDGNSNSFLKVQNSEFRNGISKGVSGAVSLVLTKAQFEDCLFENNESEYGGSIAAYSDSTLQFYRGTIRNSTAHQYGGAIYMSTGEIGVFNSTVSDSVNSALYLTDMDKVEVENSNIFNNSGQEGAGMFLYSTVEKRLKNTTFQDNIATGRGGGLFLENTHDSDTVSVQSIQECVFNRNYAEEYGGAIFSDGLSLYVSSSNFTQNESQTGGAIYLICIFQFSCQSQIEYSNFIQNSAVIQGGAIKWDHKKPVTISNYFSDNTAFYGDDIASYAVSMVNQELSLRNLNNIPVITQVSGIAPGQTTSTPIVIYLVDQYNNIVTTDNQSIGSLSTKDSQTSLSGTTEVRAVEGMYNFTSFILGYTPGQNTTIFITSNGIDLTQKTTANDQSEYNQKMSIDIFLRECQIGEYNSGNSCDICEKGTYSLNPDIPCDQCPIQADCFGSWVMYPQKEYWRPSKYTDIFYLCPNPEACIGSNNNTNYLGECGTGYTGNMCQSCIGGYSRIAPNTCGKCPEFFVNCIRLLGVIVLLVIFCTILVKMSFKSAMYEKALHSIYIKILANYLQLAYLITELELDWPKIVLDMFQIQKRTNSVSDEIYSVDCYFQEFFEDNQFEGTYYTKLVMFSVIPLLLFFICLAIWLVIGKCRNDWSVLHKELVATYIILFFLIHPNMTMFMFKVFSCRNIQGEGYYLKDLLDIKCWQGQHLRFSFGLALPSLIVWCIGLPSILLVYMIKIQKKLTTLENKVRFGFLFNGFSRKKFFWEFVILYRKIIIIFFLVYLSTVSVPIQALCILLTVIVSLYMHYKFRPYKIEHLNRLETLAILTASVTIYCGQFFLTGDLDEFSKLVLCIIMIALNIIFLIYWGIQILEVIWNITVSYIPFLTRRFAKRDGFEKNMFVSRRASRFEYLDSEGQLKYTLIPSKPRLDRGGIQKQPKTEHVKSLFKVYQEMFEEEKEKFSVHKVFKEDSFDQIQTK